MTAMAFEAAAAEWEVDQGVVRYYDDPLGFAADCIDWRGEGLTAYQQEIIGSLAERKRTAVRGPHGLGKSTIAAVTVLWFALTSDAAGVDWKAVTTAGSSAPAQAVKNAAIVD